VKTKELRIVKTKELEIVKNFDIEQFRTLVNAAFNSCIYDSDSDPQPDPVNARHKHRHPASKIGQDYYSALSLHRSDWYLANWSTAQICARATKRLREALARSGSPGEFEFGTRLAEQTIRQILPIALRLCGHHVAALRCEKEGTKEAAKAAGSSLDYMQGVISRLAGGAPSPFGTAATREATIEAVKNGIKACAGDDQVAKAAFAARCTAAAVGKSSGNGTAAGDAVMKLSADIAADILKGVYM